VAEIGLKRVRNSVDHLGEDNWNAESESNEPHELLLLYKPGGLGYVSFDSSTSGFTKIRLYIDSFPAK
jgi:hypothetical protein